MSNKEFYTKQSVEAQKAIDKATSTFRVWVFLRLLIFIAVITAVYFLWGNWKTVTPTIIIGLVVFVSAISRFQDAKTALNKAKKWKEILHCELLSIEGNYCSFENGSDFKDTKHPFAYDMDLFGENSIFQFINRTFSFKGKLFLANLLKNGATSSKEVNEMIIGLSENIEWCVQFRVNGEVNDWGESLDADLEQLKSFSFKNPSWLNPVRYILTFLGVGTFIALTLNLIDGMIFSLIIFLNLLFVGYFLKDTNRVIDIVGKFEGKVNFLMNQMQLIQQLKTDNPTLKNFMESLDKEKGALLALRDLLKIQRRFELRINVLVGVLLNGLFVWDFHQRIALKKWMNNYQQKIGNWESDLVKLEAYISGAFLKFNHSDTIFAKFTEGDDVNVIGLKHPLIPADKAVPNDVQFDKSQRLMILTGPNMAGKSTYLRSVGLLFVFANAGLPIFAQKAEIPAYTLFTSMRTSDDLSNESSYFHAELSRLRLVLNAIERGEKLFILLDEILKGTNSLDKEQGSKQFLQKLKRLNTQGIIATHDLALCELSESNDYFFNGYFDSTITENELYFDYLWRKGVCQNMNASFLLKKMGLTD